MHDQCALTSPFQGLVFICRVLPGAMPLAKGPPPLRGSGAWPSRCAVSPFPTPSPSP